MLDSADLDVIPPAAPDAAPTTIMSSSPGAVDPTAADGIEGDRTTSVVICAVVLNFVAAITVALRFYVRAKLLRAVKLEDWLILVAWAFAVVSAAFVIRESQAGLGRHLVTVSPAGVRAFLKASYFQTMGYNLSLCFTKLSILVLYLRVLTHDYIRKVTWAVIGIVVIYNAWAFAMYWTMCIPMAKMWDPSITGYCHPYSVWWALTYLHIATDFMIFIIPIPVIGTMKISARQKTGLLIVFTMGLFVCLISVVRTIFLNRLLYAEDMTWDLVVIANWSTAEINAAVVCACLPTLKPVLTKVFGPVADLIFPPPQHSLDMSGGLPRTVGSSPMNPWRGDQVLTTPTRWDMSCQRSAGGGDWSVTDIEANGSEYRSKDVDSDAALIAGWGHPVAEYIEEPPKTYARP